jgi:hypothetical protein
MRSLRRAALPLVALALVIAVVAGVAVFAMGGKSDDDEAGEKPSEGRASQVSHAALLEPQDLTGEWVLYSTDNFRNDDASLPDTGNCSAARTLAAEMSQANISRAQRALQLTVPNYTSRAQVEMHVRIFDKPATANDFLKRHRTLLMGDGYIRCLGDGFAALFGPNARVRFGDARGKAPRDGVTSAFDQDLKVEENVFQLHTDSYAWVQDNAFVLVLISGPRQLDSSDFVKEALEKTQAKVEAALNLPK